MDKYDIFRGIGEVADDLLLATETKPRRTHPALRVLAASLALVLGLWGISLHFTPDTPADTPTPWFVVTAQAADGENTELTMNEGHFNSGPSEGNVFGVDMPIFSFMLRPALWENNREVYSNFEVSLSYNGKDVGAGDDHLMIVHRFSRPNLDMPVKTEVIGWFEEPTDVTISITDKESGKTVEIITVNVCYAANVKAYELTVTDVKTNTEQK